MKRIMLLILGFLVIINSCNGYSYLGEYVFNSSRGGFCASCGSNCCSGVDAVVSHCHAEGSVPWMGYYIYANFSNFIEENFDEVMSVDICVNKTIHDLVPCSDNVTSLSFYVLESYQSNGSSSVWDYLYEVWNTITFSNTITYMGSSSVSGALDVYSCFEITNFYNAGYMDGYFVIMFNTTQEATSTFGRLSEHEGAIINVTGRAYGNYNLSGTIKDGFTLGNIQSAMIRLISSENDYITYSNALGNFNMEAKEGTYNLTISKAGYIPYTVSISITSNISQTFYLWDDGEYNLSYYELIFIDSSALTPFHPFEPIGVNPVIFEYIEGCDCTIGSIFYRTTDLNGVVSGFLPRGTYEVELTDYELLDDDGFYKTEREINMYNDYYRTIFARKFNQTYSLDITLYDSVTHSTVAGGLMQVWNDRYYYNRTSDSDGDLLFTLPQGNYAYTVKHSDYRTETGMLLIDRNTSLSFLLLPIAYVSIAFNVTDCTSNGSIAGAEIFLIGDDYVYNATTDPSGLYQFINVTSGSYVVKITKADYYPLRDETYYFNYNKTYHACLTNISDMITYCINGTVTYGEDNKTVSGLSVSTLSLIWESYHRETITHTDLNGYYRICGLFPYTHYSLKVVGSPTFNDIYYEFMVTDADITYDIQLELIEIAYLYHGYFYYDDPIALISVPVDRVQVRLILQENANISYETLTNLDGFFKFDAVIQGNYTLYGTKLLYKPYDTDLTIDHDFLIPDSHRLESPYLLMALTLVFTDANGTRLSNVKCKILSDNFEDITTSDVNGYIMFRVSQGEYLLEYEKEGYISDSKTIFVDESLNFYEIILVESVGTILDDVDNLFTGEWNKERFEENLWGIVPPMFFILLFVAFYCFMRSGLSCGGRSSYRGREI